MASESNTMIKFLSADNEIAEVPREVAIMCGTLKNVLEDCEETTAPIPLQAINGSVMKKVFQWCTHHKDDAPISEEEATKDKRTDDIPPWDMEFFKVDQPVLFEIILAANFLDVKGLLDMGCKSVANQIKGKAPEEIRRTFNIKNDFTPEEEEQIRKENAWCED